MQLTRWTPRHKVGYRSSLFPGIIDDFFTPPASDCSVPTREFVPSVDIYEKEGIVIFEADVPGFNKEDLKVDVKGRLVTISGERKEEKVEDENSYRKERRYGKFARSFQLGFEAESNTINAKYENGILKVEVPKPEGKKVKQIEIH